MVGLIILIIIVLFASGLCSMVEAAIFSVPTTRIRLLVAEKRPGAATLLKLKENLARPIAAVVIINNGVNIIGSIFVAERAIGIFGDVWLGVVSGCITFLIIIAGEIIPKTIGVNHRVPIALMSAKTLEITTLILSPLVGMLEGFSAPFTGKPVRHKITEEEIRMLIDLGRDAGTIEVDEDRLIDRVFRLNDIIASQVMTPKDKIYGLPASHTLGQSKEGVINSPHSRIVIYDKSIDKIVGICQQRVLLKEIANDNHGALIDDFTMRPIYVSGETKADVLLEKFQAHHQHLFIVQDKARKNIGIVTMEDVLEELFGEIYDERDAEKRRKK
ncbi:MAG: HlyC/CorC family transporter [Candidatus Omnitrophica bacterium]|nr:HlyC/CorC family transporter [Candidatus Omnitrophota bacterium]